MKVSKEMAALIGLGLAGLIEGILVSAHGSWVVIPQATVLGLVLGLLFFVNWIKLDIKRYFVAGFLAPILLNIFPIILSPGLFFVLYPSALIDSIIWGSLAVATFVLLPKKV